MPTATEKLTKLRDEVSHGELPYISKSRLKAYVSNPRHFYFNYILGIRGEENRHMKKGTRIHLTFEKYYESVLFNYYQESDPVLPSTPYDLVEFLPDDALLWTDWNVPYIGNFIAWELRRANEVDEYEDWIPVAVEAEAWDDSKEIPWMGFADVIVPAASVPEIEDDSGVVIVDFKTGKTPKEKYRDKGIYLEGEYYGMLFRDEYDVVGVAGYFPKNDDFIVSPLSEDRREFIEETIAEINSKGDNREEYDTNPGPLSKWGPGDDEQSDYYSICSACQEWGRPTEKWDEFVNDVKNDASYGKLASKYYDGDADSLGYWQWKANQV